MNQHRNPAFSADQMLLLLPWHAANSLPPRQAAEIDAILDCRADLADHFADIGCERNATIALHEALGAPSPRALIALFTAIEADCAARQISS